MCFKKWFLHSDSSVKVEIKGLANHRKNKCVIVVTHSNELLKEMDVVMKLKKGELRAV